MLDIDFILDVQKEALTSSTSIWISKWRNCIFEKYGNLLLFWKDNCLEQTLTGWNVCINIYTFICNDFLAVNVKQD